MNPEYVTTIAHLLKRSAERKRLISYQKFHTFFKRGDALTFRYRILEEAAQSLCDFAVADYGVLMALDNGLPSDDFFTRFKKLRHADFEAVMGYASPGRSVVKKRLIVDAERLRVFEHAANIMEVPSGASASPSQATEDRQHFYPQQRPFC